MLKTACRISSIRRTDRRSQLLAFTLVELIIGASMSGILMVCVVSTFLMMGRVGASIQNYTEIEAKARKSLEYFSREVRVAYGVTSYSGTSVTLKVPDTTSTRNGTGTGAYSVTYAFNSATGEFTRTGPPIDVPAGTVGTTTLISGIQAITGTNFLNYYRYVRQTSFDPAVGYEEGFQSNTVLNSREIKQITINFLLQRRTTTVATATNKVLSARFILRNK